MLDVFGLPSGSNVDTQVFTPNGLSFVAWSKPRGKAMLSIICIGGGAGGGGGAGNTAGAAKGGGQGGGSSGVALYLYPLALLPDMLYVRAGPGGAGGAGGSSGSGTVGSDGSVSVVSIWPHPGTANNFVAISGAAVATGGAAGTQAAGGSGAGAASTITGDVNAVFSRFAISRSYIAGVAGTAGGAQTGAVGTDQTIGTACMILGGTGGAGCTTTTYAGGGLTAVSNTPFLAYSGGAAGTAGSPGFQMSPYPIFVGGFGGGSSNSATGGAGGHGSTWGTGGGGGGGGVTVGGRGGDGGPGVVIMSVW